MKAAPDLASWKEIAEYLEIDVRTAQRWETERGLPVRRPGHNGAVEATRAELDHWRRAAAQPRSWWSSPRALRLYCLGLGIVLLAAAALAPLAKFAAGLLAAPVALRWQDTTLIVSDGEGRNLWRHTFPSPPPDSRTIPTYRRAQFHPSGAILALDQASLHCFSARGRLLWRFESRLTLRRVRVTRDGRVAVATLEEATLLDPSGRPLGTYPFTAVDESADTLDLMDLDGDGREEIWLAGYDPATGQARVTVVDQQMREQAIVRFPRTRTNREHELYNCAYDLVALPDGTMKVQVRERHEAPRPFLIYMLDRSLAVRDIDVSWTMRTWFHDFTPTELAALARQVEVIRSPGPRAAAPATAPRSPE